MCFDAENLSIKDLGTELLHAEEASGKFTQSFKSMQSTGEWGPIKDSYNDALDAIGAPLNTTE